jgi:hypothetical protein
MSKQPIKQQRNHHSWVVYHRGTPAQFIGIVYDQPDEQAAIKQALEEFKVPANQRDRLIARRRDWALSPWRPNALVAALISIASRTAADLRARNCRRLVARPADHHFARSRRHRLSASRCEPTQGGITRSGTL